MAIVYVVSPDVFVLRDGALAMVRAINTDNSCKLLNFHNGLTPLHFSGMVKWHPDKLYNYCTNPAPLHTLKGNNTNISQLFITKIAGTKQITGIQLGVKSLLCIQLWAYASPGIPLAKLALTRNIPAPAH